MALGILLPAYLNAGTFPQLFANAAIIFGAVQVVRLLFFHKHTVWLNPLWTKGAILIFLIPVILFTIQEMNLIQTTIDAEGYQVLFKQATLDAAISWGKYVRNEFIFFASALIICSLILPVILIQAAWRQVVKRNSMRH